MDLQTHFKTQLNEMPVIDAKAAYKELVKHIQGAKSSVSGAIESYQTGGRYGKMFNTLGKSKDREAIIEAFKLVQEELNRVNV